MGAANPLKFTLAPDRVGITFPLLSKFGPQFGETHTVPSLKLEPKMAVIEPGAKDEGVRAKLAPFTVPPELIAGGGRAPAVTGGNVVAATLILNGSEPVGVPGSVTCTVKLLTPVLVGVPEITTVFDVLDPNDSPAGRLPEAMDQA